MKILKIEDENLANTNLNSVPISPRKKLARRGIFVPFHTTGLRSFIIQINLKLNFALSFLSEILSVNMESTVHLRTLRRRSRST